MDDAQETNITSFAGSWLDWESSAPTVPTVACIMLIASKEVPRLKEKKRAEETNETRDSVRKPPTSANGTTWFIR